MHDQLDLNDLQYIKRLGYKPIGFTACPISAKGVVNPFATQFHLPNNKIVSVFHVKPIYYETRSGNWRPLSEITSNFGNKKITLNENWRNAHPRFIDWLTKRQSYFGQTLLLPSPFGVIPSKYQNIIRPTLNIGMTVTTVYPDPNPETTTCDGGSSSGYFSTMQLAHDATTGDGGYATSPFGNNCYIFRALRNASGYYLGRVFFLFDTSSIDSGDTVSDAVVSLYGNSFAYGDPSVTTCEIVASNPASNTDIVAGDFDAFSYTSFASIAFASMSQSAYNDFTLNASGVANVTKAGISKFGGLTGLDLNVTSMTSGHDNIFAFKEAESAGTSTDPKLVVTHTAGGGSTFIPRTVWFM